MGCKGWAAVLVLLPVLLMAGQALAGGILQVGNGSDASSLDPHRSVDMPSGRILLSLCEGLVTLDAAGRPIPGAAEGWTVSQDGLAWRFILRRGLRWSDGHPLVAEDWVWSWRRAVTPATRVGLPESLTPVRNAAAIMAGHLPPSALGIRALDERTLEVELERPSPEFLSTLSERSAMAVPRHVVEAAGETWTRPGTMVCNGPFTLVEQVHRSHLRAVRNPYYHDAAAVALDGVIWHVSDDAQAELKRFRMGELHVTDSLPATQLDWARAHLPAALRIAPYTATVFLLPNLTREPWASNPGLRLALSLAIDRDLLVGRITRAGEQPAYTLVPPGLDGIQGAPRWAGWTQEQRDAEALRLMRAAGYGPDRPLALELYYNANDANSRMAVAVASMWQAKLGVRTSFRSQDLGQVVLSLRNRDWPGLMRLSWVWNRARGYLAAMMPGPANWNGYASPAFQAAMAQADAAADSDTYRARLGEAQIIPVADAGVIPLYHQTSRHLVSSQVRGWADNILDMHLPRWLSLVE